MCFSGCRYAALMLINYHPGAGIHVHPWMYELTPLQPLMLFTSNCSYFWSGCNCQAHFSLIPFYLGYGICAHQFLSFLFHCFFLGLGWLQSPTEPISSSENQVLESVVQPEVVVPEAGLQNGRLSGYSPGSGEFPGWNSSEWHKVAEKGHLITLKSL